MRRIACSLVCVFCLATLTSCVGSDQPISDVNTAEQDAKLVGVWVQVEESETNYLHIAGEGIAAKGAKKPTPGMMRYVLVEQLASDEGVTIGGAGSGNFFVCKLGDNHYASLYPMDQPPPEPGDVPGFWLMKYKVDRDTLKIWMLGTRELAKVVESGALAGTVSKPAPLQFFHIPQVRLTATSEELAAFFKTQAGDKLFGAEPAMDYRRLR